MFLRHHFVSLTAILFALNNAKSDAHIDGDSGKFWSTLKHSLNHKKIKITLNYFQLSTPPVTWSGVVKILNVFSSKYNV